MQQLKIYIAGKVTGEDEKECMAKFMKAHLEIVKAGHIPVNPLKVVAEHTRHPWEFPWTEAMRICIKALMDCDAVYMLSDWVFSKGAETEYKLAMKLGIPVYFELEDIPAPILTGPGHTRHSKI